MGQFRNIKQIPHDSRHERPGLVVVKIPHRHIFQMGKQVPAHISLHPNTHQMPIIGHKIAQKVLQQKNHRKKTAGNQKHPQLFVLDVVVQHGAGDQGVKHIAERQKECRPHIQKEQHPVGTVVSDKFFQFLHYSLFFL